MGARQSRRSVDITTTPKKEGIPAEGGDATAPGDGKLGRIEETDAKPTTNGIAPHTDVTEDKDKDKDDATEKENDKDKEKEKLEDVKAEETKQESSVESPAETTEVATPTEATPASPNTAVSPDSKETKKKEKMKKKWSFRSISFSKKDKNKPAREETPKNGDVTKEEPLAEGGEEAENGSATAGSPVEEKSTASSPAAETESAPVVVAAAAAAAATTPTTAESKEESPASAASSPAVEKAEEPTPSAPTPVPVEEKKEEPEKVQAEKKVVEVSPAGGQFVPEPIEVSVFRVQTVATPSIIERKTSEDIPSLPPSSPPPTPIDSSPLQRAQQAAATATALAKALNLPAQSAEPADKDPVAPLQNSSASSSLCSERNEPPTTLAAAESLESKPQNLSSPCVDDPPSNLTANAESSDLPVAIPNADNIRSLSAGDGTRIVEPLSAKVDTECVESSPYDVPGKPESYLSETSVNQEPVNQDQRVTDTSRVVEHAKAGSCEAREETIQASDDAVSKTTAAIVEKPLLFSSTVPADAVSKTAAAIVDEPLLSSSTAAPVDASSCALNTESKATEVEPDVEPKVEPKVALEVEPEVEPKVASSETAVNEDAAEVAIEETPEPVVAKEQVQELIEQVVELNEIVPEEIERVEETISNPPLATTDAIVDSEEGPVPVSDEMLVEAKPAVVVPEDEEAVESMEDATKVEVAVVCKVDHETAPVVPYVEDKLETESQLDLATAMATEQVLVSEESVESKDSSVLYEAAAVELVEPVTDASPENGALAAPIDAPEPTETLEELKESMIPSAAPLPEPIVPTFHPEDAKVTDESITVPSPVVAAEPRLVDEKDTNQADGSPLSSPAPQQIETSIEPRVPDSLSVNQGDSPSNTTLPSRTDLPSEPEVPIRRVSSLDSSPLPQEKLSCPLDTSETMNNELPVPDENESNLRNPTETLLTPPRSPSPQSNISITSGLTTSTKDSSQTQLYDGQSNREFKMESVSISLNSYNESDIELKERLAESLAETEKQEGNSISRQLSNNATSTTVQEIHQSTPETVAPVENNAATHDSTTESSDETSKVAPPAVPSEVVPVNSPPSAPVITEDVASVAKAIEEMDISDKSVAAATIECNTNEIIADAHYQNDINE